MRAHFCRGSWALCVYTHKCIMAQRCEKVTKFHLLTCRANCIANVTGRKCGSQQNQGKEGECESNSVWSSFLPFEDKKFTKLKLKCILCRLSKTGACGGSNFAHKRSLQRNQFWSHLVWQDVVLNSNSLNRTRRESALQEIPVFPSHLRRYSVLR